MNAWGHNWTQSFEAKMIARSVRKFRKNLNFWQALDAYIESLHEPSFDDGRIREAQEMLSR